jgi:hypothetical protein
MPSARPVGDSMSCGDFEVPSSPVHASNEFFREKEASARCKIIKVFSSPCLGHLSKRIRNLPRKDNVRGSPEVHPSGDGWIDR